MKTRKELKKLVRQEEKRKKRVLDFLKKNEGKYYTAEEVSKILKLKCAARLLRALDEEGYMVADIKVKWYESKKCVTFYDGVESIEIPDPENLHDEWCGTITYYGYLCNLKPKNAERIIPGTIKKNRQ
jgi:hypothetical protein